jgi:autotransporter-associated beta strand protein
VYGSDTGGVIHWAGRQGTAGVQAFAGYANDDFGAGLHTNLTGDAALTEPTVTDTLRFAAGGLLDIGAGNSLSLAQGGLLIPASVTDDVTLAGGTLTSSWGAGGNDLLLHHHGQGRAVFDTVIANDGANRVNLVLAGSGTTVLAGDNTFTGDVFLNNGVLQVAGDAQLGQVNGSIARIVLVGPGQCSYSNTQWNVTRASRSASAAAVTDPVPAATFNTVSSTTASARVVSAINLDGRRRLATPAACSVVLDGTAAGSNAGAWAVLDSGNLRFNGGVLHATESFALNSGRTIFLGGNGGTLRVDPGKTLTIDGFISGDYSHVSAGNGYSSAVGLGHALGGRQRAQSRHR